MKPLLQAIARLVPPLAAAGLCLLLALLALAALGFGREEGQTLGQGIKRISKVTWDRSIRPSPPRRRAPRPGEALRPETYRSWIQSLVAATPILLTGLAVAVAFRASVLNIGAEGQYVCGAIAAMVIGLHVHAPPLIAQPALLLVAAIAGALLASVASFLERWRAVPVVLSTLLLNFVAIILLKALLQGPLHEAGAALQSEQLPELARLYHLPVRGSPPPGQPSELHVGFFVALLVAGLLSLVLRYTTFGFRVRATGENPTAARFAGIAVGRVSTATLCLSGALAGLAGGIQLAGRSPYQLLPDTGSSGFGFTGIAVALLGRLSPLGTVIAAVFFGWLQTAFAGLEAELHVPFLTLQATQGAILIAMLVLTNVKWFGRLLRRRSA
jgi:simple sugar transport system permease protein